MSAIERKYLSRQTNFPSYTAFLDLDKTLYLCDWLNIILISVQEIIMN